MATRRISCIYFLVLFAWASFPVRAQITHAAALPPTVNIPMDDPRIQLLGQIDQGNPQRPRIAYPGTGLRLRFQGSSLSLHLIADSNKSALTVVIDHGDPALQLLQKGGQTLVLARGLEQGPHTVEVYKRTETWQGIVTLLGIELPQEGTLLSLPPLPTRKLMFVGDSVTCGAGWRITPLAHPTPHTQPATHITVTEWNSAADWMRRLTWFVMEAVDSIATIAG